MVDGGVRIGWSDVPAQVRAAVEAILGGQVVSAVSQPGGFSPGTADRVVLADGRRAFVKAAGLVLNPDTPGIHRLEIAVMRSLPAEVPAPRLLGAYDDGDWVALALTDVDGRHPEAPWDPSELDRVLAAMTDLSLSLTPSPLTDIGTVWSTQTTELTAWPRIAAAPPDDLDAWAVRHLDRLVDVAAGTEDAVAGDSLVHLDIRADNLLLTDDAVIFVDWPWASLGAVWTDLALFLCSVATLGGRDPEEISRTHPLLDGVDPAALTAVVAALAGYWTEVCRAPEAPGLPTVREFQRRSGLATLRWLERRTGWR
jgi:aminoglycoside phosphotransferase (APT) family kinase protein